jgi:hypothetical protein
MSAWRNELRAKVFSSVVYSAARLLYATIRLRTKGAEQAEGLDRGIIYSVWHGRTLIGANYMKGKRAWAIISQSRDGEMQNRIFRRFGFQTIRGSTKRGGERALVEAIRVLKKGEQMTLTPDGPRGPSQKVQGGIMLMAKKSGAAIVPCGVSASRRWFAGSWDKYMIPKPFSKAVIVFGPPMILAKDLSDDELEAARLRLEEQMNAAEQEAERLAGHG